MINTVSIAAPLVIGIGEVLWDLLPSGRALGGAPMNVAAHVVQLGVQAVAVTAVGDDEEGRDILKRMDEMGVGISGIEVLRDLPTGAVDVSLDGKGVPTFSIRGPSAWDAMTCDAAKVSLAQRAAAIVFGSLAQRDPRSRATIQRMLGSARPECLKVFDVNLRPPCVSQEVVSESLAVADVLKLNDDELPVVAKMLGISGDETPMLKAIRDRFDLDWIVYTRGAKGSQMVSKNQVLSAPSWPTSVVDTVGAGDAFTAVVTVGLLRKWPCEKIQELANRVASYVCSQPGAVPRFPRELVEAAMI